MIRSYGWAGRRSEPQASNGSTDALITRHAALQNELLWMFPVACTLLGFFNNFILYLYCSCNIITSLETGSQRRRKAKRGNGAMTLIDEWKVLTVILKHSSTFNFVKVFLINYSTQTVKRHILIYFLSLSMFYLLCIYILSKILLNIFGSRFLAKSSCNESLSASMEKKWPSSRQSIFLLPVLRRGKSKIRVRHANYWTFGKLGESKLVVVGLKVVGKK